ncbi:hypothetical protein P7B02_17545 [Caulobacter segnis]|uniref:hypothetical protein n=1 Tax=Caulobacter segnis TaxID=88688 RepID=UPI002410556B|nr:hypothetical protein [Caulobacter segnis]MDG2523337.1 hypothetical protein [Caulobacter segnis]
MLLAALALSGALSTPPADVLAMNGRWSVDLSVKADEPYIKAMNLALQPDGSVTGDFYDSTIEAGRWKKKGERVCVSFRTTDGKGPYHTAACLTGATIQGQTWAEHRNFVFLWSAAR